MLPLLVALAFLATSAVASDLPLAPPTYVPASTGVRAVVAARIGDAWLVAYGATPGVVATRIDAEGHVLDVPPRLLLPGDAPVAALALGDELVIVGSHSAVRVKRDGTIDGPPHFFGISRVVAAATNGDRIAIATLLSNGFEPALQLLDRNLNVLVSRPLPSTAVSRLALAPDGSGIAVTQFGFVYGFDAGGAIVSQHFVEQMQGPLVSGNGDRFVIVWASQNGVKRTVVDGRGAAIAAAAVMAPSGSIAIATHGDGWTLFDGTGQAIEAIDVDANGASAASRTIINANSNVTAATGDGDQALLVFRTLPAGVLRAAIIDGTRIDTDVISTAVEQQTGLALAPSSASGSFIASWYEQIDPEQSLWRVRAAVILPSGVSAPVELQRGQLQQGVAAAVASGGGVNAVVWQFDGHLNAAIVTNDGTLFAPPVPIAATNAQEVAVAWNGTAFQIVWTDTQNLSWSAQLGQTGVAGPPASIFSTFTPSVTTGLSIACGGGECVAAWSEGQPPPVIEVPRQFFDLYVVRFDARGQILASHIERDVTAENRLVSVDANGNAKLVLYDAPNAVVTRLSREGSALDSTTSSIGTPVAEAVPLSITSDGFLALDARSHLLSIRFGFPPVDLGPSFRPPVAAARSGTRTTSILSYGEGDARLQQAQYFIHDPAEVPHQHAASR